MDPPPSVLLASDAAVAILSAKRDELDRRRQELLAEVADLDECLAHIEGAITILEPKSVPSSGSAQGKRGGIQEFGFRRGQIGGVAAEVLAAAHGPLTTQQVARGILAKCRLVANPAQFEQLCRIVVSSLRRLETRGKVMEVGRAARDAVLWRIAT